MNKYQVALDNVKIAPSFMGGNDEYRRHLDSAVPFLKDIVILQELVDKEIPMKVDMKDNQKIKCDKALITLVTYYKCPNKKCEFHNNYKILVDEKRCPECGQKLDWGDKCE